MARQPSVRNLAVSKLIKRRLWGRVWAVHDRRDAKSYWLIQPNRIICWPRIMTSLERFGALALRTRKNQVVVLVPANNHIREVLGMISSSIRQSAKFDVFTGFATTRSSLWKQISIWLAVTAIICFLLFPTPTGIRANPVMADNCSLDIQLGTVIPKADLKSKELIISGVVFDVQNRSKFGGLLHLQVIRVCDKTAIKLRLWDAGDSYQLSEVDH